MVFRDDLDSWLNRVTITGPALLKCCSAFHLIGEAAASAHLAASWLAFLVKQPASAAPQLQPAQLLPAQLLPAQLCGLSLRSFVIFSMRSFFACPKAYLPSSRTSRSKLMSLQSRLQLRQDLHIYSFGLQHELFWRGYSLSWIRPYLACQHVIPLRKQTPLAQASFTQVNWLISSREKKAKFILSRKMSKIQRTLCWERLFLSTDTWDFGQKSGGSIFTVDT